MSDSRDTEYLLRREATERALAAAAVSPAIRDIHLELARHYSERAAHVLVPTLRAFA